MNSDSLTYEEFSFESFRDKVVWVFLSHLNYLEVPWALETALKLNMHGAKVKIFDFTKFSDIYSQRLTVYGLSLPYWSRRILRKILFEKSSRYEKVLSHILLKAGVQVESFSMPLNFPRLAIGTRKLESFANQRWGDVNALHILHSWFSSLSRTALELDHKVPRRRANQVRTSISFASRVLDRVMTKEVPDTVFLANGRMPLPAFLTAKLRRMGLSVVLYEGGGGYMFPEISAKRIEYWFTSPANELETQEKVITFAERITSEEYFGGLEYFDLLSNRSKIPFGTPYLNPATAKEPLPIKKPYVVFFSSSEWEWNINLGIQRETLLTFGTKFESQRAFALKLLDLMPPHVTLVIRVHPSDPGIGNEHESFWNQISKNPKVILIGANDNTDSYKLASKAQVNFVWSSLLGIELGIRKFSVGIAGNAIYAKLFPGNQVWSEEQLQYFLSKPDTLDEKNIVVACAFFRYGGQLIEFSRTLPNRQVWLQGRRTDTPRFSRLPTKFSDRLH